MNMPRVPARDSVDRDGDIISPYTIANKPLAQDIVDDNLFGTIGNCSPYLLVQGRVMERLCVNANHSHLRPPRS